MTKHLCFNYITAALEFNEKRHAMEVMKDLGITYQHFTPQTMGDQYWFWNCENIPETLPGYLTIEKWDPTEMIGWGLSIQDAEKITNYKNAT